MVNFHFLNLLHPINLLHSLLLEFNSMENESFQNIMSLIKNNWNLKNSFITFYQSANFIKESNLNCLQIILSKSFIDYDSFKEPFSNLIQGKQTSNLIQIDF